MREIIGELEKLNEKLSETSDGIFLCDTELDSDSKEDAWNFICDAIECIEYAIDCLK